MDNLRSLIANAGKKGICFMEPGGVYFDEKLNSEVTIIGTGARQEADRKLKEEVTKTIVEALAKAGSLESGARLMDADKDIADLFDLTDEDYKDNLNLDLGKVLDEQDREREEKREKQLRKERGE